MKCSCVCMMQCMYDAELKEKFWVFMLKKLQHENEIKTVLDQQLVNLRKYNTDTRSPSQYMARVGNA